MKPIKNTTTSRDVSEKPLCKISTCHCEWNEAIQKHQDHTIIRLPRLPHSAPLRSQWQIYQKPHKPASVLGFTLIELIVVITILAILGTIGFIQLWSFAGSARDSARISNLTNLKKGLDLFQIKSSVYPLPDDKVDITASWVIIGYQWFAKDTVANLAKLSPGWTIDPQDPTMYITYSTNLKQDKMQAMVFLEEDTTTTTAFNNHNTRPSDTLWANITPASFLGTPLTRGNMNILLPLMKGLRESGGVIPTTYASTTSDYSKRFPKTTGDSLGILLSSTGSEKGKPVQEITSVTASGYVDVYTTTDKYQAYLTNTNIITGEGSDTLQVLSLSYKNGSDTTPPKTCPTGFIPVPGNTEFHQPGFCVMKYEAKDSWGITVSTASSTPLVSIDQPTAIAKCTSIGAHLITNNEWMTITRNVEANSQNWSSGIVGSGYIYNGHNNSAPASTLSASSNDSDWLFGITGGTGTTTAFNQKRTLILSNNQVIWDLAGNVWEHTNKANTLDGNDHGTILNKDIPNLSTYTWSAWSTTGWQGATEDMRKLYGPSNSSYGTGAGMGNIYQTDGNATANIFIRGGGWDYAADGGMFTLSLSWASVGVYNLIGFRCAR